MPNDRGIEMNVFPCAAIFRIVALLVLAALAATAAPILTPAQGQSSQVTEAIDRANALVVQKRIQEALDALREADRLSNHTCAECYLGMANLDCQLGDLQGGLDDAQRAERAAGDDRILAAEARTFRASLLVATSTGPTDEKAKEAEREYREALSLDPKRSIARFELGMLLLQEGRDTEGVAEMRAYTSGPFANPRYVDKAKRLIADPGRARALPSEDFSFSTIEGEKISKASLRGKVVLLDFWGSWCPPCRESVPILAGLRQKFPDREFELVGISSDADESTLRSFVLSHHMNWPEFLDIDGQVAGLFEIQGFPTYVILSRGGTIAFRQVGLGPDTADQLSDVIKRELAKSYTGPPPGASAPAATAPAPAPPADLHDATAAPSAPLELIFPPDDVQNGDAGGNVYRNAFLGLSYKFPGSWSTATPEMLDQMNQSRAEQMRSRGALKAVEPAQPIGSLRVAFPQLIFEASPDLRRHVPAVEITVAQASSLTLEFVQKEAEDLKQQGMTIVAPPREVTIGKRQFFRTAVQSTQSDPPAFVARFETIVAQRYRVTLEVEARSKQELDELAASAQTLAISKP